MATRHSSFTTQESLVPHAVEAELDEIFSRITDANIAGDADIAHTKLAISAGSNITISSAGVIDTSGGLGETNTASNLGSGVGVYETKSGVDLRFNSLVSQNTKLTISEDDANDEIDFTINEGNINHNALDNYVANQHVDHSSVDITAGTGLTGGGDITATRTLDVDVGVDDNEILQVDDATGLAENDYVKATAAFGMVGRTYAEVRTDLNVADGADVTGDNAPQAHAASHTDGTDDIQSATAAQKGVATATQITKLDGIEELADVTDATNVDSAGAVMEADFDAKGDLLVATADNTPTNLPVGTNDHVLTADSAEATGVKWAAVPSGFADPMTTRGDLIYKNAAGTTTRLPAGGANEVLKSDGTDIAWGTIVGVDGWKDDTANTWTYASASSFTVSGDRTNEFRVGTRLKFNQSGVKYALVASSSYSAPNTTVLIAVNDDYTIANAAISDNYYSGEMKPDGFPGAFNYTPTYSAQSGTYTSVSAEVCQFMMFGSRVIIDHTCQGTTSSGTAYIGYTVPTNLGLAHSGAATGVNHTGEGRNAPSGSGIVRFNNLNGTVIRCYAEGGSWSAGANRGWRSSGVSYEA